MSLTRPAYLSHSTIDHKISSIHEAALVASQENHGVSLLDGLTKPASGEVHLSAEALLLVLTKPVLQERGAILV
jgi:hypothetical protein